MSSLEGKIIAITGGASGIGLATSILLANRGATLSIADTNQKGLEQGLAAIAGDHHITQVIDVRIRAQVDSWIQYTVEHFGRLDGGINLAGVVTDGLPIESETDEHWEFLMGVNAKGVFNCMRAQLRYMSPSGAVVNAASVAGVVGGPTWGIYSASKHAVIGLTKSAAREVGSRNIRVNCIAPGTINTPMTQGMESRHGVRVPTRSQALDRQADPTEVANVIVFLISSDSSFVTGATYNVDGGHLC